MAEKSKPACLGISGSVGAGEAEAGEAGAGEGEDGDEVMRGGRSSSSGAVDEGVRGFLVQEIEEAVGGRETDWLLGMKLFRRPNHDFFWGSSASLTTTRSPSKSGS